jgi:signal peptidase I
LARNRKAKDKKLPREKETPMEFIASMAAVLVIGLFIVTFNFQAFEIPSASMVRTLLIGDHLFVDRTTAAPKANWASWLVPYRDIEQGDIVVFISPIQPGLHVVKRVIGVPGDRVRLQDGQLYRNGQKVVEPYVVPASPGSRLNTFPPADYAHLEREWRLTIPEHIDNGELVIPPRRYFAMGDNREESFDGRYWGFIPRENIIGRPMFIYWSFETPSDQFQKSELSERIKWLFHVAINFFTDTRWKRTLALVR